MHSTNFVFKPGQLTTILDASAGSSGKGKIGSHVCANADNWQFCCNTFAPQAGHWVVLNDGRQFFYQTLNSCAYMPEKYEMMYIAPGAMIELPAFFREMEENNVPRNKIGISPVAAILREEDAKFERGLVDLDGNACRHSGTMGRGTTAHGVGACQARRVLRRKEALYARDIPELKEFLCDVPTEIMDRLDKGQAGLLEIAQGFQLSYLLAQFFPFCLSGDSRVLMANGKTKKIRDLEGSIGELVLTKDSDGRIVERPIINWFRNPLEGRKWYNVVTKTSAWSDYDQAYRGAKFTEDHKVQTTKGIKRVDQLVPGDHVFTNEKKLNGNGWQVLLGSLLGDGTICDLEKSPARRKFEETHCVEQFGYLKAKTEVLQEYIGGKIRPIKAGDKSFKPGVIQHRFGSSFQRTLMEAAEDLGCNGKKTPSVEKIIYCIDKLGLAIWYQDDGQYKEASNGQEVMLHTQGFTDEENERLIAAIQEKFSTHFTINRTTDGKPYLRLRRQDIGKWFDMIAPFVHPTMAYKLPKDYRHQARWQLPENQPIVCATEEVTKIVEIRPQERRRGYDTCFCIEVGDTHNFFVSNDKGYINVENCTSRNCTVAAGFNDLMVPVNYAGNVILNLRSYPIRINSKKFVDKEGNHLTWDQVEKGTEGVDYDIIDSPSGPGYDDSEELTWEQVTKESGSPEPIMEMTSVTKLPRRIFSFSKKNLADAIRYNRTGHGDVMLSLNFANYIDHGLYGRSDAMGRLVSALSAEAAAAGLGEKLFKWINTNFTVDQQLMLRFVGTGPNTEHFIDIGTH